MLKTIRFIVRLVPHGERNHVRRSAVGTGSHTAYLPSAVAPIGLSPENLPIGVQIVGPQYHDLRCVRFAQLLEEQYRAFVAPPGY